MIPISFLFLAAAPVPADPPFPEDVQILLRKLNEPAAEKRSEALQQLRLLPGGRTSPARSGSAAVRSSPRR